jgi:chromosome partitioning protein
MAHIVTMYNNKGGVSKTTTIFNLGVFLAEQHRILLVDCDPQCNATELFLASTSVLDDPGTELPGTSIYQALLPRFGGDTSAIDAKGVELVPSSLYRNLYLLRGDLDFSMAENYFGTAWNQAITENINEKKTYVVLYRLLRALAELHSFRYVLCDVGPSTGAITRTVVLASDGFLLPLTPDRFCNQAVKVLGRVVTQWINRHREITRTLPPFGIEAFPGSPVLYGAIIQNFKVYSGKAKQSYAKWQKLIAENIQGELLATGGLALGPKCDRRNPFIASIREVGPLAPVAQMFGRAIFDIRQEDTKEASTTGSMYYGTVWQPWVERMNEYKTEIAKIAGALP